MFRVFKSGRYVQIWTRCGIKVNFDGRHAVSVVVPGRYRNRMEGICGNCNGDMNDDFTMKNGTDVRNRNDRYSRVGDSFAVPDDSGRTDPKYVCYHIIYTVGEKGRDLTQSYAKAPTTTEKSKKQRDNTKTPPKTSITQRLRTDLGRSVRVTIATQLLWSKQLIIAAM